MANDNTIKIFQLGHGDVSIGLKAIAHSKGGAESVVCEFDPVTGVITNLPRHMCWDGVATREDVVDRAGELVRAFTFEVVYPAGAGIVITQREGNTNRYKGSIGETTEELESRSFPPCHVDFHQLSEKELASFPDNGPLYVWTAPMAAKKSGPNRIDAWKVGLNGDISLFAFYLITLDNGKTFQVSMQERWTGHAAVRPSGSSYTLQSKDKRTQAFYGDKRNGDVRAMLDRYIFVPGEHSENFEGRMEILANRTFRELVDKASVKQWSGGGENFWSERKPSVMLGEGQGHIKFMTYGVGRTSFGIVQLAKSVTIDGYEHRSVQFDHRAVVGDMTDDQGIMFLAPGTVVDVDPSDLVDMGWKTDTEAYPPKARKIVPRLTPVPIEPETKSLAA